MVGPASVARWETTRAPAVEGRRLSSEEGGHGGVVTRTIRSIPVEVPIGPEDGLPAQCVVNVDEILTVPKARLAERITTLSSEKMCAVDKAIAFALHLNP
ncbi:MAG: type II toxin-antitoxin system PemK/MazF family toxin [Dehalococcoidia bacterium]|nr:type II toxin-antitoxin system PemK/MazF family toxin [Dehalococcoidia bacterium]